MTIHNEHKALTPIVAGCMFLFCGACMPSVEPGNIPVDVPPEVAFIIQNRSQFAQKGFEELAEVNVGHVVDDLSTLSGCWGASYNATFLGLPFTGYEVYSFDPASGEGRYFVLQGPFRVSEHEFTFTVGANDRIRLRRQMPDGTEIPVNVLMTLSESELKVAYMSQDGNYLDGSPGDSNDERVGLVFRAFDCPEADGK